MAKRPSLVTVGTGYNSGSNINANLLSIQEAFDNTLSRDGSSPNTMNADLDMNGNDILNVGTISVGGLVVDGGNQQDYLDAALAAQAAAEMARDEAVAAAAEVGANANYKSSFESRTVAAAATIDASVTRISVLHDGSVYEYVRDTSGTALTTAGSVKWSPATVAATPGHWGATSLVDVDQATYIQACFDWVKGSRNSAIEQFEHHFDGENKTYVVKTSLNFGGVRSPDLLVRNLHVFGDCFGKIVIDATHSNQMIWENCVVVGNEDNVPASGWHLGRNSTGAIAPNHKMIACRTKGSFRYAAVFNNASESWTCESCYFENNSTRTLAYAVAICGNNTILANRFSGYASDYYTWFTGSQSCISHNLGFMQISRPSRSTLTISAISKSVNPVVTVNVSDLAASHFQAGDAVYFHDLQGMTELNYQYGTIASINAGAGTITLSSSDFNTSTYSTFTSGRLWTRTGPGLFLAACSNVVLNGNYILTYGNRSVEVDLTQGNVRGIDLTFQQEASPDRVIQFYVNAAHTTTDWRVKLRNISQSIQASVFNTSGSGSVKFENLELLFSSDGDGSSFPSGTSVFSPRNDFDVYNANLVVPDRAAVQSYSSVTLPDDFVGRVYAYDDDSTVIHGGLKFPPLLSFRDNNVLTQFEEGPWTPWLRFGGLSNGMTYTDREGRYVRIGDWVTLTWRITLSNKGSSTGAVTIENIPFNVLQAQSGSGAITNYSAMSSITGALYVQPNASTDTILMRQGGATSATNLTDANFNNTTSITGSVTYRVG